MKWILSLFYLSSSYARALCCKKTRHLLNPRMGLLYVCQNTCIFRVGSREMHVQPVPHTEAARAPNILLHAHNSRSAWVAWLGASQMKDSGGRQNCRDIKRNSDGSHHTGQPALPSSLCSPLSHSYFFPIWLWPLSSWLSAAFAAFTVYWTFPW